MGTSGAHWRPLLCPRGVARQGWQGVTGGSDGRALASQSLQSVTWHWHGALTWHGAHSHWESADCRDWGPTRSRVHWGPKIVIWWNSEFSTKMRQQHFSLLVFCFFFILNIQTQPLASILPRVEAAEDHWPPPGPGWLSSSLLGPDRHRLTIGTNQELLLKIISSHLYGRRFSLNSYVYWEYSQGMEYEHWKFQHLKSRLVSSVI